MVIERLDPGGVRVIEDMTDRVSISNTVCHLIALFSRRVKTRSPGVSIDKKKLFVIDGPENGP